MFVCRLLWHGPGHTGLGESTALQDYPTVNSSRAAIVGNHGEPLVLKLHMVNKTEQLILADRSFVENVVLLSVAHFVCPDLCERVCRFGDESDR